MDEIWPTDDACVKAQCAFDTNGNPIIKTQREICNTICQAVSQYSRFYSVDQSQNLIFMLHFIYYQNISAGFGTETNTRQVLW